MKTVISFLFILVMGFAAFAQEYEYGKPSELKGLTKIYVLTGTDLKMRAKITEEIEKAKLPNVVFVDSPQDAQIMLYFSGKPKDVVSGEGLVLINGIGKARLLISVKTSNKTKGETRLPAKLAGEFIKHYKIANDLR